MDTIKETSTPVYGQLVQTLRERITGGSYTPNEFLGSEYELVRQTGLSRKSVRKAIDCLVEERLVERQPGKGLYVVDPARQMLARVEVVIHNYSTFLNRGLAAGVSASAKDLFAEVHAYEAGTSFDHALGLIERLPESGFDGAIILGFNHPRFFETAFKLKTSGFPFVLVDVPNSPLEIDCVLLDNYQAGHDLATHLLELGHTRIAFVGDTDSGSVTQRLEGARDAILDAGLTFPGELTRKLDVIPLSDWRPEIERQTKALMNIENRPSAVIFSCDLVALEACKIMREMGICVPNDICIAGFDGEMVGEYTHPTLTTMEQPCNKLGRKALELLLNRIKMPEEQVSEIKVKAKLVTRESTVAFCEKSKEAE